MRLLLAILLLLVAAPALAQQSQGMSQAVVVSSCGGGALPSGALNQLTMDTTGRLCQSGIGSNVCTQAAAYLARTTGGNEGGNAVNITALICGLVSDGIITGDLLTGKCGSYLDALYILAQQNQADALLNLCGTSYTLTKISFPIFTTFVGFGPASGNGGLATSFNPSTATGPNFVQNSASYGFWAYTATVDTKPQMGQATSGVGNSQIYDNFTGNLFYPTINSAGGLSPNVSSPGTPGLYVADRLSSASSVAYYNGVSRGTVTDASAAPLSLGFVIGVLSGVQTNQTISEAHIGGSLGPTLELALYNRLRTYLTAVGVP